MRPCIVLWRGIFRLPQIINLCLSLLTNCPSAFQEFRVWLCSARHSWWNLLPVINSEFLLSGLVLVLVLQPFVLIFSCLCARGSGNFCKMEGWIYICKRTDRCARTRTNVYVCADPTYRREEAQKHYKFHSIPNPYVHTYTWILSTEFAYVHVNISTYIYMNTSNPSSTFHTDIHMSTIPSPTL